MADLVIHNVNDEVIDTLSALAEKHGTSIEIEHRRILEITLLNQKQKSFIEALMSMPNVGEDEDFEHPSSKSV